MQPDLRMRNAWSFEDLQCLDVEEWWRYQIIDGALLVSPSTGSRHEFISARVRSSLIRAAPDSHLVIGPMGVRIRRSYLIPDLFVLRTNDYREVSAFEAADAQLVVEIESPGSISIDRVLKATKYAEAGIANFWRVESDPVRLVAYALPAEATVYAEVGSWDVGDVAELDAPFPVSIEIARLQPPGDG